MPVVVISALVFPEGGGEGRVIGRRGGRVRRGGRAGRSTNRRETGNQANAYRARGIGLGRIIGRAFRPPVPDRVLVAAHEWTEDEMLKSGLTLARFTDQRQDVHQKTNLRRFRSHYGVGPAALAALYNRPRR